MEKSTELIFFFLAITTPLCYPGCGVNSHCEYDVLGENKCVCNPGTIGNPYEECDSQSKKSCSNITCGIGALCKEKLNSVECYCSSGFKGNPYVQCVGKYSINRNLIN